MNELQNKLELWIENLGSPKRRLQYFILSLIVIYLIWVFVFYRPLRVSKNLLESQVQGLRTQLAETDKSIKQLHEEISQESIAKALAEKKQLEVKIQQKDHAIGSGPLLFISKEDWKTLKKEIVVKQADMDANIILESMTDLPLQLWVPQTVDQKDVATILQGDIFQHALEIKFQADYFSTIKYLSRLENLPWHVYWDSLSYKVLTYPKAEVTVKFHIFTKEKSET